MPEYLAPGVYVEEVDTGPKPIEGVSTSTSGMVGVTERGPVNVPTLVTGIADFKRQFGWYLDRRVYISDTWYLPHAVEGFFTNGGKRLYLVRVLPDTATSAETLLFDRGSSTGASTQLASSALAGYTALLLESTTGISDKDWLRLDDEDFTEYVQADLPTTPPLPNRGVRALRTPLYFNHAAGASTPIQVFQMPPTPAPNDLSTTLDGDVSAGETRIRLASRTNVNRDEILSIGAAGSPRREFAVVASLPADPADRTITLRHPLAFNHVGTGATPEPVQLVNEGPAGALTQLNQNANTGMALLFLDNLGAGGADFDPGDVVRIGTATDANREYHVLADLRAFGLRIPVAFALRNPVYADHPVTEPVQVITLTGFTLAGPANSGTATLPLTNRTGLAPGDRLLIGTGPTQEVRVISSVPTNPADNSVTLDQNLANNHPATDPVFRLLTLQSPASAGSQTLTLVDRRGLNRGELIRIGTGATQEVLLIAVVPTDVMDNTVTINHPLTFSHPVTDTVVRVTPIPATPSPITTTIVQSLRKGESLLLLADLGTAPNDFAPNKIVEVGAQGSPTVEYQTLGNAVDLGLVGIVGLSGMDTADGLAHDHAHGVGIVERNPLLRVQAIDAGAWGNCLEISVEDDNPLLETKAAADPNPASNTLTLSSTVGIETGTVLEIDYSTGSALRKVTNVTGNVVTLSASHGVAVGAGTKVRTKEFLLTVECIQINPLTGKPRTLASETHRHLSMDPRHSRYATKVIGAIFRTDATTPRRADGRTDGESDLIRVEDALANPADGTLSLSAQATAQNTIRLGPDLIFDGRGQPVSIAMVNGDDDIGNVTDDTYIGQDAVNPRDRQGLYALKNIDEIAIVAIPGRTSQKVQQAMTDHCELMRYRFAVLDSQVGDGVAEVQEQRGLYDSKYGAIYYPWLRITDPFPDNRRNPGQVSIPPSGHVMGIYARSDIERGVHKAPANEVIRGIADLEAKLMKEEQDILNPVNINVLRNFRENNRGLRIWGARTLSSDPDWKYINVRRLFIFIEHSIDRGTQWVVFELNNEFLWERVKRVISAFLTQVWHNGALMGKTREEAYFVKCDRTTMTQNDIDNGRLIVQIGIAPVKPAEFVIFRIGQWAGGSELEEG